MGFGKGALIVVLSFLLILTSFSLSFFLSANLLLEPETYEKTFEKNNLYEDLYKQFFGGNELSENKIHISPSDLKNTVNGMVRGVLDFAKGDNDDIYLYINNNSLKNFFIKQVENVRVCNPGESSFDSSSEVVCRPAGKSSDELVNEMFEKRNMSQVLATDKVNMGDLFGKYKDFQKMQRFITYYYNSIFILSVLLIGLIILIFMIDKNDWKKGLKISGISIFVAGLVSVLTVKFIEFILSRYIELTPETMYLQNSLLDLVKEVLSTVNLIGIIAMVIEGAILLYLYIKGKKEDHKK
ncbi:MAG: hypothetical protein AABW82_02205 [Nanoarchaeota archaeon]